MNVTMSSLLDVAEAIVKERLARNGIYPHLKECGTLYRGCAPDCPKRVHELLEVSTKTIGQIVKQYDDQLTNAVYDVWNGHSAAVDFRRAHKALLREFAPQAFDEGIREGGITEPDGEDETVRDEVVSDWLSEQVGYVNDFAAAVVEAKGDKDKRAAILDRVVMWVDAMRSLGERGRAYAMQNVKATWELGDRQTHTPDCIDLSKKAAHRVSWWIERGYQPPIHLGCGCRLADAKSGETIMGE